MEDLAVLGCSVLQGRFGVWQRWALAWIHAEAYIICNKSVLDINISESVSILRTSSNFVILQLAIGLWMHKMNLLPTTCSGCSGPRYRMACRQYPRILLLGSIENRR